MPTVLISGPGTITITVLAQWTVPNLTLPDGGSFDLKTTLPPGTPTGGTFAVQSGTLAGLTLDPLTGILHDPAGGAGYTDSGLAFSYTTP